MKKLDTYQKADVASIVDLLIFAALFIIPQQLGYLNILNLYFLFPYLVLFVFARPVFYISNWQATPGQRIMGIYATDESGKKVEFLKAVDKYDLVVFFIVGLMLIFSSKLVYDHDLIIILPIIGCLTWALRKNKYKNLIYLRGGKL